VVASEIRERIWDVREKSSGDEMLEWIDSQIDLLKVTEGTKQHYRTLLMRLREYGRMKS
jgi:hypothetical protein